MKLKPKFINFIKIAYRKKMVDG